MHTRAEWKLLPYGNPRAARKSRKRDLNLYVKHLTKKKPAGKTPAGWMIFRIT